MKYCDRWILLVLFVNVEEFAVGRPETVWWHSGGSRETFKKYAGWVDVYLSAATRPTKCSRVN
jgi:hypothetical protein